MEIVHEGKKSVICSTCGKAFYSISHMNQHFKIVSPNGILLPPDGNLLDGNTRSNSSTTSGGHIDFADDDVA